MTNGSSKNPNINKRTSTSAGIVLIFAAAMTTLLLASSATTAQTETVLYSFSNPSDNVYYPVTSLIADNAGNLYGMAGGGGPSRMGGIFELSPPAVQGGPWTETTLYSFLGKPDAGLPSAGLVMDGNGALYGTTAGGGANSVGAVFQLSPPAVQGGAWTESVLYSFTGANGIGGSYPNSALVFDKNGNLFGTASSGGSRGGGTVFRLTPPSTSGGSWGFSVVLSFAGNEDSSGGCNPGASLLLGPDGSFFGTTRSCGANDGGVAYKLTPPLDGGQWTETVIHTFGPYNTSGDGNQPEANLVSGPGGALFGTTFIGGASDSGTVFELSPPSAKGGAWTETILHSFAAVEGNNPACALALTAGGSLYGTTVAGGANGQGAVFMLTPPAISGDPWIEVTLFSFSSTGGSGQFPDAGLLLLKGAFYGTTAYGGTLGGGNVFKIF